jgi:hypothetical protein
MRNRIRKALSPRSRGPWILASALLVALLVTPFAGAFGEGNTVKGGARNPSPDARRAYTQETEIIANVNTFGTRQSNKSNNGGGAVYGCRSGAGGSTKGNEPCLRASNLAAGRAFEFNTNSGTEVGEITGPATAAPFTTTAKGVATGLNADQVDGQSASEIVATAQALNKFAVVNGADGALGEKRGATTSARSATGIYSVDFSSDVSKCARTATITGTGAGQITTALTDNDTVAVRTFDGAGAAADQSFHLTVTC